jgi:hypothetical protein
MVVVITIAVQERIKFESQSTKYLRFSGRGDVRLHRHYLREILIIWTREE